MAEFKTVSLADQVFEKLENDIIIGVYPRGEVLTELKLVEQLGVSRTPIREALRRLEQERLIKDSGKGSVVLGITTVDIMYIRQRVEAMAAYYAAERITPVGAEELQHILTLQEFYCQKKDLEHVRQLDDQFHDAIYALCGSTVVRDVLQPLHKKTMRYRKISIEDESRLVLSVQEHRSILEAIVAGDGPKAEKLTALHIQNAKESMMARLQNNG